MTTTKRPNEPLNVMPARSRPTATPLAGPGAWTPSPSVDCIEPTSPLASPQISRTLSGLVLDPFPLDGIPRPVSIPSTPTKPSPLTTPVYAARKRKRSLQITYGCPSLASPTPYQPPSASRSSRNPTSNVVELVNFRGKGQGLLAVRDISSGEEILRERPFITFEQPIDKDALHKTFEALSREDKETYLSFTATVPDVKDKLVGIAETNAIDIYNDEDTQEGHIFKNKAHRGNVGRSGLFKNICRVNHSCCPTAGWTWHHDTHELGLIAFTSIRAGSEILVSYKSNDVAESRDRRRQILLKAFGFVCACGPCTSPNVAESDANLAEYRAIREACRADPRKFAMDRRAALKQIRRCSEIADKEGKLGLVEDLIEVEFSIYAFWGLREKAKERAQAAFQGQSKKLGRDRALVLGCAFWKTHPEKYWGWEKCLKEYKESKMKDINDDDSDFGESKGRKKKPKKDSLKR